MMKRNKLVPKELGSRYTFERHEVMNFNEVTLVNVKDGFLFRNGTDYIDLKRSDNFHKGRKEVFDQDLLCLVALYHYKHESESDGLVKQVFLLENAFVLSVDNPVDCYTYDEIISYYKRIGKL